MHDNARAKQIIDDRERMIEEKNSRLVEVQSSYSALTEAIENAFATPEIISNSSVTAA